MSPRPPAAAGREPLQCRSAVPEPARTPDGAPFTLISHVRAASHAAVMNLTFLGAAGTVTGSKHRLEVDGRRMLVDCGLFQGLKELRLRNWDPLPIDPATTD